jgi:hypothetical protein
VAAETVTDVVENRNIVRPEKLCPAAYIVKGARKYSRATKVQVPLLITLVLLLGFIIADQLLPECVKPWGDCNPAFVQSAGDELHVFNADSTMIWKREFECPLVYIRSNSAVADLDGDGTREVLLLVQNERLCQSTHHLLALRCDGQMLWEGDCRIPNEYPGDVGDSMWYAGAVLHVVWVNKEPVIITDLIQDNPSRNLYKFWDRKGAQKSWYINAGAAGLPLVIDLHDDEIVFAGTNRRLLGAAVFALQADSTMGASPPYKDPEYDLSRVKPGNQLNYVVCPATRLCRERRVLYPNVEVLQSSASVDSTGGFVLVTHEGDSLQQLFYYFDSECRVRAVDFGDLFKVDWSRMMKEDVEQIDWNALGDTLERAIKYWTDSGFVTEGALKDAGQ